MRKEAGRRGRFDFRPGHLSSRSSGFSDRQTDRQTDRHRFLKASSLFTSAMGADGGTVEVLASFILLDWLSAVANLGFPPIGKRRG